MIGLPRSGKSTWANEWLNINKNPAYLYRDMNIGWETIRIGKPRVVVSGDDIRMALYGQRYNSHVEEYVFAIEHTMIKALLNRGHDVLVDDTHTTWKSIQALLNIDPNALPIWFPGDQYGKSTHKIPSKDFQEHIMLCKERAVQTGQQDLFPIIDRMASNLERMYPEFEEKLARYRTEAKTLTHRIV
jgi:hypothetical protein